MFHRFPGIWATHVDEDFLISLDMMLVLLEEYLTANEHDFNLLGIASSSKCVPT